MDQLSECKDVGPSVRFFPFHLLGCHVLERADDHAVAGQFRLLQGHLGQSCRERRRARLLRQAKVQELGAALGQHDVRGLKIAMRDPQLVRFGQRARNLCRVSQSLLRRQRPPDEPLFQRFAFQVLHDQKIHAVLMANVMEAADVRMREFGNCLGFAFQPLFERNVRGEACGQNFNRNLAVQPRIARARYTSPMPPAPSGATIS